MAPDLNSLPPSRSTSSSPMQSRVFQPNPDALRRQTPSPSPRSSSVSLAAAATMNAADMSRRSSTSNTRGSPAGARASERRRSAVTMNLNLNDPTLPGPGELSSSDHRSSIGHAFRNASPTSIGGSPTIATGDPHHQRAPSLGEIHQELEQEQEAQVNRLLQMIRAQQQQLQQLQAQQAGNQAGSALGQHSSALDDSTPTSERSFSLQTPFPALPTPTAQTSRPIHRRDSRSQTTSPALRPLLSASSGSVIDSSSPAEAFPLLSGDVRRGSRDESAFYQAETQNLTRENQMLRHRIRELERQIAELSSSPANAPATPSNLATSPPEELNINQTSSLSAAIAADGEADKPQPQS